MWSRTSLRNGFKSLAAAGSILFFFIMAFEVLIMISPFAFFFYSVFNPVFGWLGKYAATRWLTDFFLPHMILPPTPFLKTVRVLGSVLFIAGAASFIVCALQVYLGKIFRWGVADKGLYSVVRHPQYLSLGIWGVGMCILWPRFIVLVSLSVMFLLYYFLARDEERRMLGQHGSSYAEYLQSRGMFLPKALETRFAFIGRLVPSPALRFALAIVIVPVLVIGCGFGMRTITLDSLAYASKDNLTLISILPEDEHLEASAVNAILAADSGLQHDSSYLGYLMPADYIMQGMIADTGENFHLYKQHHSIAMITEWVLHPFSHLRASPSLHMAKMHNVDPAFARRHHCPLAIDDPALNCETCPYKRIIIVQVATASQHPALGRQVLAVGRERVPIEVIDLNTTTGEVVSIKKVAKATAWENVPTPAI
jgi:protein-S-isoprenylcysteine O-methyltransferase Ste14